MAKCRICGAGAEEYSTLCRDCGQNPEELADIIDSRDAEVAALKAEVERLREFSTKQAKELEQTHAYYQRRYNHQCRRAKIEVLEQVYMRQEKHKNPRAVIPNMLAKLKQEGE